MMGKNNTVWIVESKSPYGGGWIVDEHRRTRQLARWIAAMKRKYDTRGYKWRVVAFDRRKP